MDLIQETRTGEEKRKEITNEQDNEEQEEQSVLGDRRRQVSRYLKSPYEKHVQNYNISLAGKKLLAYSWDKELPRSETIFQCQNLGLPQMLREDLMTLNKGNFIHLLHVKASDDEEKGIRRLCMTITTSKVVDDERKRLEDKRNSKQAAADFMWKTNACKKITKNRIDFRNMEYNFYGMGNGHA
ncbi:hypothetical protein Leryth_021613 [Lithospermum erythrorhizon]|nr:hypothetical protein Leryth_021613 [Lithospermum erythrorhizon]